MKTLLVNLLIFILILQSLTNLSHAFSVICIYIGASVWLFLSFVYSCAFILPDSCTVKCSIVPDLVISIYFSTSHHKLHIWSPTTRWWENPEILRRCWTSNRRRPCCRTLHTFRKSNNTPVKKNLNFENPFALQILATRLLLATYKLILLTVVWSTIFLDNECQLKVLIVTFWILGLVTSAYLNGKRMNQAAWDRNFGAKNVFATVVEQSRHIRKWLKLAVNTQFMLRAIETDL